MNENLFDMQRFLFDEYGMKSVDITTESEFAYDGRHIPVMQVPCDTTVKILLSHEGFIKLVNDLIEYKLHNSSNHINSAGKCAEYTFDEVMSFNYVAE